MGNLCPNWHQDWGKWCEKCLETIRDKEKAWNEPRSKFHLSTVNYNNGRLLLVDLAKKNLLIVDSQL